MALREIGASVTMDANTFKREMSAVNSNLSGLRAEMKATTAEFADNADSVEALTAKQRILDQQEEQQKVKVAALTKAYAEQAEATGEDSVEADRLKKQLMQAREEMAKTESANKKNTAALEQATKETRIHTAAVKAGELAMAGLKKAGSGAVAGVKLAGQAMGATAKAAAALTAAGAAATTALGALAVSGMKTLISYSVEAAQAVDKDGHLINAQFSTLAGNLAGLSSATDTAKVALGSVLLPALESLTGEGQKLLEGFVTDLTAAEGDTEKMGRVVASYLRQGVALIREQLPEFLTLGKDILSGLLEGADEELPELLELGMEIVTELLDAIEEYAPELGAAAMTIIQTLGGFILANAPDLLSAGIQMLANIISGISEHLPELIPVAIDAIVQLLTALVTNAPMLISAGLELILGLVQGLIDAIPQLIAAVPALIKAFKEAWDAKADDMKQIGTQIIEKVVEGLVNAWHKVTEWWNNAMSSLRGNATVDIDNGGRQSASGINYVPYDTMPAILHRGEQVLTADEARRQSGSATVVNLTINAKQLTPADVDYIVAVVNRDLGGEL